MCRLTVPLCLKVASSDQTLKSGKICFHHTCTKTTYKVPFMDVDCAYSLHGTVLVCAISTAHAAR
jgi:hypothetical protein